MNRILFEPEEAEGGEVVLTGDRARHVREVLRAAPGARLRLGEIGGPRHDAAELLSVGPDACRVRLGPPSPPLPRAPVDLLLALPRPKCLRRLWPQLGALGPGRVYLTAAEKVEKDYWGSTFLRPEVRRALLLDGLAQAGDTRLPEVEVHRRLKPLVQDALPARYAPGRRLLAHPAADGAGEGAPPGAGAPEAPLLVAVGPEGGWSDFELRLFEEAGFRRLSLGPRILRTDTAVVALLALLAGGPRLARPENAWKTAGNVVE